jgi:hypothetical protein
LEFPELGFDAEEAAVEPLATDDGIDLEALLGPATPQGGCFGVDRGVVVVPFGLKLSEIFAGFAEDELSFGIEAGLEWGFDRVDRRRSPVPLPSFCVLRRLASICFRVGMFSPFLPDFRLSTGEAGLRNSDL